MNQIKQQNPAKVQESYRATEGKALIEQIQEKSGRSRSGAKKLIASGRVSVEGVPTTRAEEQPPTGALITIHTTAPAGPFRHLRLQVVWENEEYVVIYKEAGIPTVNTAHRDRRATALYLLSQHYKKTNPQAKLFMVSRLDRSTAGFVVFAKSAEAKELLVRQWGKLVTEQRFAACIEGAVPAPQFQLEGVTKVEGKRGEEMQKVITAQVTVQKSGAKGGMHAVEINVERDRIFSVRQLLALNQLSIVGDVRSSSGFESRGTIALQMIALGLQLPSTHQPLLFKRPFPHQYITMLRQDPGLLTKTTK